MLLKWRYDETNTKLQEIHKRSHKIKKLLELYEGKIKEIEAENDVILNPPDLMFERPLINSARSIRVNGSDSLSTKNKIGKELKKKVLVRMSEKSPSKYVSSQQSIHDRISDNLSDVSPDRSFAYLGNSNAKGYGTSVPTHPRMPSFANANDFIAN